MGSRRISTLVLAALAAGLLAATAADAKRTASTCTTKSGKARIKADGRTLQTLRSGQYRAVRHPGGTWTFCDGKAPVRRAFKSFNFDTGGQRSTGVRLLSRPGRCLVLQLRPRSGGIPSLPAIDMRPGKGIAASLTQIDFQAPGARIVKVELSSTCLLGVAYVSKDGSRHILLDPLIGPNVRNEAIQLSAAATDRDLRALSLRGDDVSWTDAGVRQSKRYSGLP